MKKNEAIRTLAVGEIVPAKNNTHFKSKKSDPEFNGLVESLKQQGMIHRIVVRPGEDGKYEIVDGHRRYEAAIAAGWAEVPVEVRELDDFGAMSMTITANVQRTENDPFLEAEHIEKMRTKEGKTFREIAVAMGKSEDYVIRRARLTSLVKEWRYFAKSHDCDLVLLRNVASHDPELQRKVADECAIANMDESQKYDWSDFKDEFSQRLYTLEDGGFDTEPCANCPCNTANQKNLFPWLDEEAPKCQKSACYIQKANAAVDALVERLRKAGTPAIEVADRLKIPNHWDSSELYNRKHPQAYIYQIGEMKKVMWSVKPEKKNADRPALTAEERQQRKEEKRIERGTRSAMEKITDAINGTPTADMRSTLEAAIKDEDGRKLIVEYILGCIEDSADDTFCKLALKLAGGIAEFTEAYDLEDFSPDEVDALHKVLDEDKEDS